MKNIKTNELIKGIRISGKGKVNEETLKGIEKDIKSVNGDVSLLAIKSSSKMSNFCKDTAFGIANFYKEEAYPLTSLELKPFIKQITKEFKKIWK